MEKGKMKKVSTVCLILILGLFTLLVPKRARAAGTSTNLDVVMVLDVSGSMKTTDPKRISLEGAKLFADMMESSHSRAGFVAFDTAITKQYALTELDSVKDKMAFKKAVDALEYTKGDTNIGAALDLAVQMLEKAEDTGNKKMVLFFTDGNIDLDNRPQVESEEEKKSLEDSRAAAARAAEKGIGIYTIGLNAGKNDRFEIDPELITEIADKTGGICRIVSSAEELPGAFNDIFAHIIDSEIDDLGEVTIQNEETFEETVIHIPNESVLEANIILFTGESGDLEEVQLLDPNNEIQDADDQTLFHTDSDAYHMLKIIAPDAGDWLLKMKGIAGSKIHVNLIFNYDITMEASAELDEAADAVHVTARLLRKGLILTDEAIYTQMTAVVNGKNQDGQEASYSMELDEQNNYFCDVPLKEGEAVTLQVHIEGANMYRDSEEMEFSRLLPEIEEEEETVAEEEEPEEAEEAVEEEEPAFTVKARSQTTPLILKGLYPGMCRKALELTEFFETDDPQAAALTYSVKSKASNVVDAVAKDGALELTGKGKGTSYVEVTAKDANGETYTAGVEVQVSALVESLPVLIIGCAVIICVLVIIIMLIMKRRS